MQKVVGEVQFNNLKIKKKFKEFKTKWMILM